MIASLVTPRTLILFFRSIWITLCIWHPFVPGAWDVPNNILCGLNKLLTILKRGVGGLVLSFSALTIFSKWEFKSMFLWYPSGIRYHLFSKYTELWVDDYGRKAPSQHKFSHLFSVCLTFKSSPCIATRWIDPDLVQRLGGDMGDYYFGSARRNQYILLFLYKYWSYAGIG